MRFLVTGSQMRALDQHTIEKLGIPGIDLMRTAGEAVAEFCKSIMSEPGSTTIVCGKGNNGGDGFIVAASLAAAGHSVCVFILGERDAISGDAALALQGMDDMLPSEQLHVYFLGDDSFDALFQESLDGSVLVIDALLGTGINKPVREPFLSTIQEINGSGCPIISVDIPSGVDASTGEILGTAIYADATITFAFEKRGHHQYPGAELSGDLHCAEIGIPTSLAGEFQLNSWLLEPEDGPFLLPRRPRDSHKGSYGHVGIWAGAESMPGAGVLTLNGALRSGVGLVSWFADSSTIARGENRPPEVMLREFNGGLDASFWAKNLGKLTAMVVGPGIGLGPLRKAELKNLMEASKVPLCLDADALTLVASDPTLLQGTAIPLVLTPHPKEMARLTGLSVLEIQKNRIEVAQQFATKYELTLILKGARTVVASADGKVAVIGAGNPGLATGGSGDVLAGMVGSFLAQGFKPFTAAQLGALLHACAGDAAASRLGEAGMVASDIVDGIGTVLTQWNR